MSWILLSKGLCNNLQNDLIEEAMEVQSDQKIYSGFWCTKVSSASTNASAGFPPLSCLCYLFLDPDGLISAMRAEGSAYLELLEGYNCKLQEHHGNDWHSALCNLVLLELFVKGECLKSSNILNAPWSEISRIC